MDWKKTADEAPPAKDLNVIWGYLSDSSVRLLEYWSAERIAKIEGGSPDEFQAGWYEVDDRHAEWHPKYWLPLSAIPRS